MGKEEKLLHEQILREHASDDECGACEGTGTGDHGGECPRCHGAGLNPISLVDEYGT